MKKAFIHIGTHKTGSTTIQHFIATNEEFLSNHNIYLPQTGKRDVEYADYQNIAWELSENKKFNKNNGTIEELKNEILRVKPDNIILSSEAFGFQKDNTDLPQKLKLFFENLGYEVYIIAFVRPQYRYIDSMYSEMAKRGIITVSFENYVKRALSSKRYNYLELFKEWQNNFNNIIILPFEKAQWESSLEVEFFKSLPIKIDLEYIKKNILSTQNERADAKFIEIVRITVQKCIKLGLTPEEIEKVIAKIRKLSRKYKWDNGTFCGLDNETAALIYDNYEELNREFSRNFMALNENENLFREKKENFKFKKNIFDYKDFNDEEKSEVHKLITDILVNKKEIQTTIKKKKLCIVHIGMHKTGTSSIQHNLQNRKGRNFSYFDLGEKNHSFMIGSFFTQDPEKFHLNKMRSGFTKSQIDDYNINFDNKFKSHLLMHEEYDTFVISGEGIIGLSKKSLKDLKTYLSLFFEKIKIVAYIRSPISYVNSSFQQAIKSGRMNSFSLDKRKPQYKNKFEKFDHVFGKKNVFLYHFDRKHLIGEDVCLDFIKRNNLDLPNEFFLTTNKSLSLEAISLFYVYHKYNQKTCIDRNKNNALIKILLKFGSRKLKLGEKILKPFLHEEEEDIKWIEDRMDMKILDDENYFDLNNNINSEEDLISVAKQVINEFKEFITDENLVNENTLQDIVGLIEDLRLKPSIA